MCGINGLIYKNQKPNLQEISMMNRSISHRGPDDEGILSFENTLLGHVRLSIQDLSKKGRQPMSVDNRYWIVYNGEIYNFQNIKSDLEKKGYKFYSKTDTEVILNSFKEWGTKAFFKFNGMWSFAILDKEKKELIISRDRYGVKPCYISKQNNKIIFSSEIKGIISSEENYNLDSKKFLLADKYKERCFTTEYENIDIVQPGFFYKINITNLEISKHRWWNGLNNLPKIEISRKKRIEDLKNKLNEAIKLRLISDTKIATSLSGGVDSSIIFTILNKMESNNKKIDLNPFIVSYDKNKTIDQAINLSKKYNKEPVIIECKEEDDLSNLSNLFSSIELTTIYNNQYNLYKKQNKMGFKISIDGHGADECFGGYKSDLMYFGMHFQNNIANLYETLTNLGGEKYLTNIVNKFGLIKSLKKFNLNTQNIITNNYITNSYTQNHKIDLIPESLKEDIINLDNFDFPFQILYLNANYGHMQWLLNKWDKSSMAHSVEMRSPFLDWNLFQYAIALPPETKIERGVNKSLLRESYQSEMPEEINNIKFKQGLPSSEIKINAKSLKIIQKIIHEKDFQNNSIWNGKKILNDFNSKKNIENISEIWKLVRIHLMDSGFKNRKKNLNKKNLNQKERYNILI